MGRKEDEKKRETSKMAAITVNSFAYLLLHEYFFMPA